jgi:Flp pilus assembly protein TadD
VIVLLASILYFRSIRPSVPPEGSQTYEQVTRVFYRGLAALEVGLLDQAKQEFTQATQLAPAEPAGWANLGVSHLRLGELDAAAGPVMRAVALAPGNADVVTLAGRMEIARGRIDEGITHLRRAVELDPNALRARYTLAQEVERSGAANADEEAQRLFDDLLMRASGNLAVLLDRTRVASRRGDGERVRDSIARLERFATSFALPAREQFDALKRASAAGAWPDAARATALLRNVLARDPIYRESLAAVSTPTELIAEPFTRFVAMKIPSAKPAPADMSWSFVPDPTRLPPVSVASITYFPDSTGTLSIYTEDVTDTGVRQILPFDADHDFRTDLLTVGRDGVTLLRQTGKSPEGRVLFSGVQPLPLFRCDCTQAWAADLEMDGDLDLVLGVANGPTVVLRNNGDLTFRELTTFSSVKDARGFAWADLDGDGDPDAVLLDATGAIHFFANHQAGSFVERVLVARDAAAFTVADLDGDGSFDLAVLDRAGALSRVGLDGHATPLATGVPGDRVIAADLDNNGAIDLIVSGDDRSRVLLASDDHRYVPLSREVPGRVQQVLDVDGDGMLDLDTTAGDRRVRFLGRGTKGYHWKAIRAQAQERAGDQRINSFGIGGDIQIRSGLLSQKQILTGVPAHFGLGTHSGIDVARIVWPNGVPQAEFDVKVDDAIVAEQRLKGSCPWLFAFDGERMRFVTDFLWRSPLGLRINAQDTAGVTQTEDWVRLRGDQLVPRDGAYDIRITAELWETHFFDHVSLMTVDHPADTEVYVDERFSAMHPPRLAVQAVRNVRPVGQARDDRGRDVTDLVARRDGRYLAGFDYGEYQGIAKPHYVEFELDAAAAGDAHLTLLASGWVYPTDSSINVALGQNANAPARAMTLESQDAEGRWTVASEDIGFPAGKNKTMVVDVSGVRDARRLRLRTNLEVYWDSLQLASAIDTPLRTERLAASSAELRYRGFSRTTSPRGESPETPNYDRLANTEPRWRDLAGYYTRFGDVRELLAAVDDRYVIMNAGDEMRLRYPVPAPPPAGWMRDFVVIGDGWEKDGDYNTGYSQTVLPLPTHARQTYEAATTSAELEDDPVYRLHPGDWERYHTRYVTPDRFLRGLR